MMIGECLMNGFQEWLHDEICRYQTWSVFSLEEIIEGLEFELEVFREVWEEEQAELEDEAEDEEGDDECEYMDDDELKEWCAEQRLKNVLPPDAPNPYFAPQEPARC
jgi:hypothetical protein